MKMCIASSAKQLMTRKDSEKDSERPHYYSQFWLDIAAGRRTIDGPKPEEEEELLEDAPEPIVLRRPLRNEPEEDLDGADGHGELPAAITRSIVEPDVEQQEESVASAPDELPIASDDLEGPNLNDTVEDADIPDMDFAEEDEENEEDEDLFEDEEEDEEDEGWVAGRGRKKASPKRPIKQPPVKRTKREPRRGF